MCPNLLQTLFLDINADYPSPTPPPSPSPSPPPIPLHIALQGILGTPAPDTLISQIIAAPHAPIAIFPQGKKYYVVTVGRCCGVFSSWSYVNSLVNGIPGNTFVGYYTYDEAMDEYSNAKAAGIVEVVRDDEDDLTFGPIEDAIM
ncbi:hypothetical protein F5887DRAFT_892942 [Amanita rubescens]|nr:hypothetical protein F5887DRAFT_892942 [Amanita rubescens]